MNIYSYHHLSKKISRSSAEVLAQLLYWLSKQDQRLGHIEEGRQWIRNSYRQWQEQLGKLSISTIRRAFADLEKQGIVLTNHFEKGKKYRGGEQVKYFSVDFEKLHQIIEPVQMNTPTQYKMNSNIVQNEQPFTDNLSPITNQNTDSAQKNINDACHTVGQSMFNIWSHIVLVKLQEKGLVKNTILTQKRSTYLCKALSQFFNNDLKNWTSFCEKIASNDFLMGGGSKGFCARLDWTLEFESIEKILSGFYDYDEKKHQNRDGKQRDKAASAEKLLPVVMPEELSFEEKNLRDLLLKQLGQGLYVAWVQGETIEFSTEEGVKPTLIVDSEYKAFKIESCPQLRKITPYFDKIEWRENKENEVVERLTDQDLDQETETTIKNMARANKMDVKEVLQSLEADVMEDMALAKDVDLALKQALLRKRAMIAGNVGYLNYKGWFKGARMLQTKEGDILHVDTTFQKDTMCQRYEKVMEGFIDIQVVNQPSLKLSKFAEKGDNSLNTLSLGA